MTSLSLKRMKRTTQVSFSTKVWQQAWFIPLKISPHVANIQKRPKSSDGDVRGRKGFLFQIQSIEIILNIINLVQLFQFGRKLLCSPLWSDWTVLISNSASPRLASLCSDLSSEKEKSLLELSTQSWLPKCKISGKMGEKNRVFSKKVGGGSRPQFTFFFIKKMRFLFQKHCFKSF